MSEQELKRAAPENWASANACPRGMITPRGTARLAALVTIVIWASTLISPVIFAQVAEGLPPGIRSVVVDGHPIDASTVPITNTATPEISGRVDLGEPMIELVVGDVGAIRVAAELDNRGRFRVTVPRALADGEYSLSINDLPIGSFAVDSASQVRDETAQPGGRYPLLDIARVVPYPVDFGENAPGIGVLDGRYFTLEEEAARTAAAEGETTAHDVRQSQRSLGEAGWLQRYENRLAVPNAANPETFDLQMSSFVVEYASGDHASAAFATLAGADAEVEFPLIGDESALTLMSGVTPDTGSEYQAARLIFRIGPMLSVIVYADLLNQQPDLALLESVAQSIAARAAVVVDHNTVPLSAMVLRLDPSDATDRLVRRDIYDVRAGALTALFAEDEATRDRRAEIFTGTTDAFSSRTIGTFAVRGEDMRDREPNSVTLAAPAPMSVVAIEGESTRSINIATPQAIERESDREAEGPDPAQVSATTVLYAFPGDAEADVWLSANQERLVAGTASSRKTFTEVPDVPAFGDDSITFETRGATGIDEQTANGFRVLARVGAVVAVLDIASSTDLPMHDVANLMELQVQCIEAGGCRGLATLSGRLIEYEFVEPRSPVIVEPTQIPRQEPTPAPIDEPAPAPVLEPEPVPIEEPIPPPVEEPTLEPVEEPATAPGEEPAAVEEATPPVAEEPAPTVGAELSPTQGEAPTSDPGVDPTPAPVTESTPSPAMEPTSVSEGESALAPIVEPAPAPVAEPEPRETTDRPDDRDNDRRRGRDRRRDRDN
jgi:hypothetical protein